MCAALASDEIHYEEPLRALRVRLRVPMAAFESAVLKKAVRKAFKRADAALDSNARELMVQILADEATDGCESTLEFRLKQKVRLVEKGAARGVPRKPSMFGFKRPNVVTAALLRELVAEDKKRLEEHARHAEATEAAHAVAMAKRTASG